MKGSFRTRLYKSAVLLATGGSTLALSADGCLYASSRDIQTFLQESGAAAIGAGSKSILGEVGTDFETVVRVPGTVFVQSIWRNFVDLQIPEDVPNTPTLQR